MSFVILSTALECESTLRTGRLYFLKIDLDMVLYVRTSLSSSSVHWYFELVPVFLFLLFVRESLSVVFESL